MSDKSFAIRLVTPAGKLLDGRATYAMVPAHDGLTGFQPNRAPIVFELGLGELRVDFAGEGKTAGGGSRSYLIEDGFGQMANNRLTVLTTKAWPVEEIDEGAASAELAAVEGRAASGGKEMTAWNRDRERAQAKVRLARLAAGKGI
ncbi:MAG: F0F1 ATP synthase subunit epsilon [Phycisphaerales bacterium]|nr:F0F1 ATP synthase subunit epsilon [Phycisphaerales bacterium]